MTCLWLNVVVPDTAHQIFFSVPFLSSVWVLSCHIIGSAWFLLHSRALSQVQTDSHLFSIFHSSPPFFKPTQPPQPPTPPLAPVGKYQLCDRRTQTVALSRSPPGPDEMREVRRKEYNRLPLLYSGHFNTDLTSVNRGTRWLSRDPWELVDFFFLFLQLLCRCI